MNKEREKLEALNEIKDMMKRSSRFISLSGWSGVSAGLCAIIGAALAHYFIASYEVNPDSTDQLINRLSMLALLVFSAAFICAFGFTYLRSKKMGVPIWGIAAKKMFTNVAIPFFAGAILILHLMMLGEYALFAPASLIVYGIALFCGSQQSTNEMRYLASSEMILGCLALWFLGHGLLFWTIGFGGLHIIYGIIMWYKYERN